MMTVSREKNTEYQNNYRSKNRASGVCADCGRDLGKLSVYRCDECFRKHSDRSKNKYNNRKVAGLCVRCGRNKSVTVGVAGRCLDCFFKDSAKKISSRGDKRKIEWKYLKQLWEAQDGKCAITGASLIPGFNAQVDHVVPKHRGGTNDIENLRWTLDTVNRSKGTMLDDEFLEFIELVYRSIKHG